MGAAATGEVVEPIPSNDNKNTTATINDKTGGIVHRYTGNSAGNNKYNSANTNMHNFGGGGGGGGQHLVDLAGPSSSPVQLST
jgi:hypothetical protein